jgi:hypothetical protein
MQCAAYAIMYEERTKIPVPKIVVIIAVENERVQIFVKKRNDFTEEFILYRKLYEELNHV